MARTRLPRPNAKKGAYYKSRTREWLKERGYQVAEMEVIRWIFRKSNRSTADGVAPELIENAVVSSSPMLPVKRDQFASDLIAMSATELIFIQVKGGKDAGTGTFPEARRAFMEHAFPPFVKKWIVAWPERAREPRIIDVDALPAPPERRKPAESIQETLF